MADIETHGDILAFCNAGETQGLVSGLPSDGLAAPQQERPAFKVKPPFRVTRMRDWRGKGRRCAWLWSLRGRAWVVEQELYLGQAILPQKPL